MANFVYNVASGEDFYSQWKRHLQQTEYISDITSAIKSQTKSYEAQIRKASEAISSSVDEASRRQAEAINDAASIVVGKLDQGFSDLSIGLSSLESSISRMATMLDWRLSQMIDQQRISNLLLGNIALLLRIPDVQKERQYYIEQGFKHYKNAALDNDLYQDALDNLLEAEKREKTDYVVLHRIGMIYLYSPKMLDLQRAVDYLRRAAKYAVVESDPNAHRIFNILLGDVSKPLSEQSIPPDAPKMIAAESYFQAGVACYAQGKFADAIELSSNAFSLLPSMLEAGFMKAKALAAAGGDAEVAEVLEGIIKTERFYSIKTATDGDLAPKSSIQALLARLRYNAVKQAIERVERCRANMLSDSVALPILHKVETLIHRNTYLDALEALDQLTCERTWDSPYLWKDPYAMQTHSIKTGYADVYALNNGRLIVSTSNPKGLGMWDTKTGELIWSSEIDPSDYIHGFSFSPDGRVIASRSKSIKLWDAASGALIQTIGYMNPIEVVFFRDRSMLAIHLGSQERNILLWDIVKGSVAQSFTSEGLISISPDGSTIATSEKGLVHLWDTNSGLLLQTIKPQEENSSTEFSPDGTSIAVGCQNYPTQLWDIKSGNLIRYIEGSGRGDKLAFSADGKILATYNGRDKTFQLWNLATNKLILVRAVSHDSYSYYGSKIKFNPFSPILIIISEHSSTSIGSLWCGKTGGLIRTFEAPSMLAPEAALNPDGSTLAIQDAYHGTINLLRVGRPSIESFVKVERELRQLATEAQRRAEAETKELFEEEQRLQLQINQLLAMAKAEEEKQDNKWFGKKDYQKALGLYQDASASGSQFAKERLKAIQAKIEASR